MAGKAARREEARRREAERLDAEVLEAIGGGWDDPLDEAGFDRLARDLFAHQLRFNPVYRQLAASRGVGAPADVRHWSEIPAVPSGAFKVGRWAAFPEDRETAAFRTSGTTTDVAGVHRFESLGLVNAAVIASARHALVPDRTGLACLFLSPSPREAPDSSLVHMLAVFGAAFGPPVGFYLTGRPGDGGLREAAWEADLDRAADAGWPVLVAGSALAFHFVLAGTGAARALPAGSRAMVTGGFKGRTTASDPHRLGEAIERRLGIPVARQVQEYGMTELSSQFYDGRLVAGGAPDVFEPPPWVRVRVVEPTTGRDVPTGETGTLVHVDLANRGSAVAVATSDLGSRVGAGFRLAGREPCTEARGCSLAAEIWLERV